MPPKKGKKVAAPAPPPLDGCVVALSGTFPNYTQSRLEKEFINPLGATLAKSIAATTTHLITTESDFTKPSAKVRQAQEYDVCIVNLDWLKDCSDQSTRLSEKDYSLDAPSISTAPISGTPSIGTGIPSRKRSVRSASIVADSIDDSTTSQTQLPKKNKSVSTPKVQATVEGQINVATSKDINIPIDESCPLASYRVYIADDGLIYDAALNQTNAGGNNNKFYRVQVLQDGSDYKTWTRWGRVGERGSGAVLGDGSLITAIKQFESKFKSKTGLSWDDRGDNAKPNKYTFVERSYGDDSDDEETAMDMDTAKSEVVKAPESTLQPAVQELMKLVFNQQYFAATMSDLNYDVNKLPLGKLSKNTITRGYQTLKDLAALLHDPSLASEHGMTYNSAIGNLSNSFYSLIPHAFGRNRPPVIQDQDMLLKELQLLDSLGDMKDAAGIMKEELKDVGKINMLDKQFQGLNLNEMTPLERKSVEFSELQKYLVNTRGATHNANYEVDEIFRIERQGEKDRFEKSLFSGPPRDRRLLWHGSRSTNFGGILSQGLRIAPPEAPVSGYMFGKGIYLADMSSKSANYCCAHISNGHALLLLCEAELGDPMQVLTSASYSAGEDAKDMGMSSTWGQGTTGPSVWKDAGCVHHELEGVKMPDTTVLPGPTDVNNAYLMYNEYIAYDIAQVRLRYLFRVRM